MSSVASSNTLVWHFRGGFESATPIFPWKMFSFLRDCRIPLKQLASVRWRPQVRQGREVLPANGLQVGPHQRAGARHWGQLHVLRLRPLAKATRSSFPISHCFCQAYISSELCFSFRICPFAQYQVPRTAPAGRPSAMA